jgi:hypothetical protein
MCWLKVCSIRYHSVSLSNFPTQVASLDHHWAPSRMLCQQKRRNYKTNSVILL